MRLRAQATFTRRLFIQRLLASSGVLFLRGFERVPAGILPKATLRMVLVLPPKSADHFATSGSRADSVERGVSLGVEEARRTGELLGHEVECTTLRQGPAAFETIERLHPACVIGGFDDDGSRLSAEAAQRAGSLFLNVGSRADALRGCSANTFHFEASDVMYERAVEAHDARDATAAVLWHPDLVRYGAAQLNERFSRAFGLGMDGAAWAGWMAVKVPWEASLRSHSVEMSELAAYLLSSKTRFDGHKGWPLTFDPISRQLLQPLYVVDSGLKRLIGEVPVRDDDRPPHEQLAELARLEDDAPCGKVYSEQ